MTALERETGSLIDAEDEDRMMEINQLLKENTLLREQLKASSHHRLPLFFSFLFLHHTSYAYLKLNHITTQIEEIATQNARSETTAARADAAAAHAEASLAAKEVPNGLICHPFYLFHTMRINHGNNRSQPPVSQRRELWWRWRNQRMR